MGLEIKIHLHLYHSRVKTLLSIGRIFLPGSFQCKGSRQKVSYCIINCISHLRCTHDLPSWLPTHELFCCFSFSTVYLSSAHIPVIYSRSTSRVRLVAPKDVCFWRIFGHHLYTFHCKLHTHVYPSAFCYFKVPKRNFFGLERFISASYHHQTAPPRQCLKQSGGGGEEQERTKTELECK